jgi:phosphoribosylaminoimidazole-succinocarboxamide synthase
MCVLLYKGKVRNVYSIDADTLLLEATDRTSGFNKHLCEIQNKGILLNKMSEFWFNTTTHIVPNHLLCSNGRYSIVKKCVPFKIEVVVRGYITGNTETSLWTHYKKGLRNYCGIDFPDGLIQNQKLNEPVVTPTTKDANDQPITPEEIINNKYMTDDEMDYVFRKALELYNYAAEYTADRGLLLVDTKYEFGKDMDGGLMLIDEVHTCDSSRYWKKDTYNERFIEGKSPEKYDKDQIRDWVNTQCDPYKDEIPEIPQDIINLTFNSYEEFYKILVNEKPEYTPLSIADMLSFYNN